MNVAFVHPSSPDDEGTGATYSATRIVTGLADRGHDVTVYCLSAPPTGYEPPDGIELRRLELGGFPYHSGAQRNAALRDRLAEFEAFDVVHSYLMSTLPAMGEVGAETSAATVVSLNAYLGICPKNDLRYLDRERCTGNGVLKCTACSLATSGGDEEYGAPYVAASRLGTLKHVREAARVAGRIDGFHALAPHVKSAYAEFGYPSSRIHVVPNVLDERFLVTHTSAFEPPYRLLYVGALRQRKGTDRLVPLLERLERRYPGAFELTVVGDGGARERARRLASERGLADRIEFAGRVPNDGLPAVYAAHDAFVYPGRWDEPFGRVFLEALAAGTPVVATDVGSVDSIVGEAGIVTDNSVDGLAAGIVEATDPERLAALSEHAVKQAREYRAAAVIPQIERLYETAARR